MSVNFFPLDIGQKALRANQVGLAVTGQNIANVNTPGYTRQELNLAANSAIGATQLVGSGVTIEGVRSIRDLFIDQRLRTETGITGELNAKQDALAPLEAVFNSNGSGISSSLNNFFASFRNLEASPTSITARIATIDSAQQLSQDFNSASSNLIDIRSSIDSQLRDKVDQVNDLTSKVADLNTQIKIAKGTGSSTSELLDQRNQLIHSISDLTGAHLTQNSDQTINLSLADGQPLLVSDQPIKLVVSNSPITGLAALSIKGNPAIFAGGQIKGLQEASDQVTTNLGQLDGLASTIATKVNALHTAGSDLNGQNGTPFFNIPANNAPITAANLAVSPAVKANPKLVVAANLNAGSGDGSTARQIANLLTDRSSQVGNLSGSFSSIYGGIVKDVGTAVSSTSDALTTQQAILTQLQEQQQAVSGVSIDEEVVNLLRYQKAFEGAAKFLKVADELTQTILSIGQ